MKKFMHVKPSAYIYLYYPGLIVSVDSMFACLITERMKKAKSNQKISFSPTFKVFIVIVMKNNSSIFGVVFIAFIHK